MPPEKQATYTLPFYTRNMDRSSDLYNALDGSDYYNIKTLLTSEHLNHLIMSGHITLGLIRPSVGPEANIYAYSDLKTSKIIEEMIHYLGIMAKFSFIFNKESVELLYEGDPKNRMLSEAPLDNKHYSSRWPEFIDFMSSGPSTALLLYSDEGNAVNIWRSQLGHWNIDKERDTSTIRGKIGTNKYNNLVHGSDSPVAVIRELSIINNTL